MTVGGDIGSSHGPTGQAQRDRKVPRCRDRHHEGNRGNCGDPVAGHGTPRTTRKSGPGVTAAIVRIAATVSKTMEQSFPDGRAERVRHGTRINACNGLVSTGDGRYGRPERRPRGAPGPPGLVDGHRQGRGVGSRFIVSEPRARPRHAAIPRRERQCCCVFAGRGQGRVCGPVARVHLRRARGPMRRPEGRSGGACSGA